MIIATKIQNELKSLSIRYDLIVRNEQQSLQAFVESMALNANTVVRSALLCDDDYFCLAVIPVDHLFDFSGLKSLTQRNLRFSERKNIEALFPDCQSAHLPLCGQVYQVDTYYDASLQRATSVLFAAGNDKCLIRVSNEDFQSLMRSCQNGHISVPPATLVLPASGQAVSNKKDGNRKESNRIAVNSIDFYRFQSLLPEPVSDNRLEDSPIPALSSLVVSIMKAHADSELTLADLKCNLDGNTGLFDKICVIINSPLFRDVLGPFSNSIEDEPEEIAINGCLYSLILGLLLIEQFNIQTDGVLTKPILWHQAILSTALAVRLADEDYRTSVNQSILILSGLVQNIGLLYYGQEQTDRYYLFNSLLELNPGYDLIQLEWLLSPERVAATAGDYTSRIAKAKAKASGQETSVVFEENHAILGAAMIEYWDLPEEVVYAVRYHHDPGYDDSYYHCPNLLLLANCLLLPEDQPSMETCRFSAKLFERIKVTPERCRQLAARFKKKHNELMAELRVRDHSGLKF